MDELYEAWLEIERRALLTLRGSARVRGKARRVVQALTLPSFASRTSHEVFAIDDDGGAFIGVKRVWQAEVDRAKVATPVEWLRHDRTVEPTLVERSAPLPRSSAEVVVGELRALTVPLVPASCGVGLDGTAFVLAVGDGFGVSSFEWWQEPPSEWSGLGSALRKVVNLVDAALGDGE